MPWQNLAVAGELVDEGVGGEGLAFGADGCEVLEGVGRTVAFGEDGGEVLEADADVGVGMVLIFFEKKP